MADRRIQFIVDEDLASKLEELKEKTKSRTMQELMGNAIAMLEWAVNEKAMKRRIASADDKITTVTVRFLEMPALSRVS